MEGEIYKIIIDRLTDEDIVKISNNTIVERQSNNNLDDNSIYDRHMGVCERGKLCEVCSHDWNECVGGYGYIKLNIPFYFQNNGKYIVEFINNVCSTCYKIGKGILKNKKQVVCDCEGKTFLIAEKKNKDL